MKELGSSSSSSSTSIISNSTFLGWGCSRLRRWGLLVGNSSTRSSNSGRYYGRGVRGWCSITIVIFIISISISISINNINIRCSSIRTSVSSVGGNTHRGVCVYTCIWFGRGMKGKGDVELHSGWRFGGLHLPGKREHML